MATRKQNVRDVNRRQMAQQASWLLKAIDENDARKSGGGFTQAELGSFLGRSGGFAWAIARNDSSLRIKPTVEQERWLNALFTLEKNKKRMDTAMISEVKELRGKLGECIGIVDGLSRRIAQRRRGK